MNKLSSLLFLVVGVGLLWLSCGDETTLISAIRDGEQLEEDTRLPFMLDQNYPNPFNSSTTIPFRTATLIHLTLKVYTDDWQEVGTLIDEVMLPGIHIVTFNAKNFEGKELPSGEYFYTLEGEGLTLVRKMKLIK